MSEKGTVVVIGAGTAGNAAARSLAGSGWRVVQVERDRWGGTCLWRGCIPKKSLYRCAQVARLVAVAEQFGVVPGQASLDWQSVLGWKWHAQTTFAGDQEAIARGRGIEVVCGSAAFVSPTAVAVAERTIEADHFVIAAGSEPVELRVPGADLADSSEDALHYDSVPASLVIVGGGFIAFEMAGIFASFGSQVTVVTHADRFLEMLDSDLADVAIRHLSDIGVRFISQSSVQRITGERGGLSVTLTAENGDPLELQCARLVSAIGRRPAIGDLALDTAGIETDGNGHVVVDEFLRTTNPKVWAAGDAAGGMMHTPVANLEGRTVARSIDEGVPQHPDCSAMPATCFTVPQLATVGLTQQQAREKGVDPHVTRIGLDAIGAAIIDGDTDGFIKLVSDRETGVLLGAQIAAPQAGDLIYSAVVALKAKVTAEQLGTMVAIHPSHAELVYYAGG